MNEEALNRLFILAENDGYKKSFEEFKVLMSSNEDAINTMYGLAKGDGYRKDINEFKTLVGFDGSTDVKKKDETLPQPGQTSEVIGQPSTGTPAVESGLTLQSPTSTGLVSPLDGSTLALEEEQRRKQILESPMYSEEYKAKFATTETPTTETQITTKPTTLPEFVEKQQRKTEVENKFKSLVDSEDIVNKALKIETIDPDPNVFGDTSFDINSGRWLSFNQNTLTQEEENELIKKGFIKNPQKNNGEYLKPISGEVLYFLPDKINTIKRLNAAKEFADEEYLLKSDGIKPGSIQEEKEVDLSMQQKYDVAKGVLTTAGVETNSTNVDKFVDRYKDLLSQSLGVKEELTDDQMYELSLKSFNQDPSGEQLTKILQNKMRTQKGSNFNYLLAKSLKEQSTEPLSKIDLTDEKAFKLTDTQYKFIEEVINARNYLANTRQEEKTNSFRKEVEKGYLERNGLNVDDAKSDMTSYLSDLSDLSLTPKDRIIIGLKRNLQAAENRNDTKAIEALKKQIQSVDKNYENELYDSRTGMYISNTAKDIPQRVIDENKRIEKYLAEYSKDDIGSLMKRRDDVLMKMFQVAQELENNPDAYTSDARTAKFFAGLYSGDSGIMTPAQKLERNSGNYWFKLKSNPDLYNLFAIINSDGIFKDEELERVRALQEEYRAINSVIAKNEDPGSEYMLSQEGFWNSFGTAFTQGVRDLVGYRVDDPLSDSQKADIVIEAIGRDYELTDSQKEKIENTSPEKLGTLVGGILPVMGEIVVDALIVKSGTSIIGAGKFIEKISKGKKGLEKALNYGLGLVESAATFELAGQGAAAGVGEKLGEDAIDQIFKSITSKNPILKAIIGTVGGTIGEGVAEYSGEFVDRLVSGQNYEDAIIDTFGRTPEDAKEKAALTFIAASLMSAPMSTLNALSSKYKDANGKYEGDSPFINAAIELEENKDNDVIDALIGTQPKADIEEISPEDKIEAPEVTEKRKERIAELNSLLASDAASLQETGMGNLIPEARQEVQQELETLKAEQDATQEQAAGQVSVQPEAKVGEEELKADIERRRQKELDKNIDNKNTEENRRPNGSIGTQGFDPTQLRDLISFLNKELALNISEDLLKDSEKLKPIIEYIKNNKELVERIKGYVKTNPIEVITLPDSSLQFQDGNHRANLLNLIGSDILPTIEKSTKDEINAKYDAELATLKTETDATQEPAPTTKPTTEPEVVTEKEVGTVDDQGRSAKPGDRLFNDPNPETSEISSKYKQSKGISTSPGENITELDIDNSMRLADAYEEMQDNPSDPEVQEAYNALAKETVDQYKAMTDAGYEIEIYEGEGEPYSNSQEMIDDLKNNKHMYIFSTESGFGEQGITDTQRKENSMLQDSGFKDKNGKPLLINDLFRGVHDFFGHSERGNGFGAKGEENAWDVHARMFTDKARRAMTTETRGQNSWVNFGPQMRNESGQIIKKGEPGYLSATERAFAPQKMGLLPLEFSKIIDDKIEVEAKPEMTEGANKLLDALKPKVDKTNVRKQVDNAKKAIANVSPETKIIVHETSEDYVSSGKGRKQNEGGEYDIDNNTIHINLENANERTVAHEVFHAILLNKGMSNKQAQAITTRMLDAVKKSASPELTKRLDDFSSKYDEPLQSEESIAELFGILASEYETLPRPTQSLVKRWLDKLAKLFGLKPFTDNEIIDMLNVVSAKVESGQEITKQDVKILDGSVSGVINGQVRKQDSALVGFTLKRFPTNPNIKLSENTPLSDFNGKKSNLLESDRMTGAFIADANNNPVFKFFGGIYFPQITGKWWASRTLSKANSIAENMNANRDKDGYIYATPIIMKPNSHMSNQDMFETVWEFMKFDLRSRSSKVTKKLFSEYITKALTLKSVNLTESDLGIKKSDSIEVMISKLDDILIGKEIDNPNYDSTKPESVDNAKKITEDTTLSFEKRKAIIKGILGDPKITEDRKFPTAGSISEVASKFEEEKTKQATKLWDVVMLMRTKGTLSSKVTPKSDEFYHKSYPAEISSDQEIEVFFLDGAYNIDTTYPELTQSSGKVFSWKEYSEKHPSAEMALSQYGRTAKLSKASGDIVAPQSRKQIVGLQGKSPKEVVSRVRKQVPEGTPSIADVRAKAKELNISESDTILALKQLGYSDAEISTEAKARMDKAINDAKDKYELSVKKRGNKHKDGVESALNDLKKSDWYSNADDTARENAVREIESFFGEKIKKAPSVAKTLGNKKDKITVDEMAALKSQIRLEARSSMKSIKAYKDAAKSIIVAVKQLEKKGLITLNQSTVIIKKVLSTNMLNEKMVDKLTDYIEKVYKKADISDKILTINKLRKRAIKNLKSKVGPFKELQQVLKDLFSIDGTSIPINKIDSYIEILEQFGGSSTVLNLSESGGVLSSAYDILKSIEKVDDVDIESVSLTNELNETIEEDFEGYIKEIISNKIDLENVQKGDAKRLAEFLNSLTKSDLEALVKEKKDGTKDYSMLEKLKELKSNMTNGYVNKLANTVRNTVEINRGKGLVRDVIKKVTNISLSAAFSRAYGKIKGAFTNKSGLTESIRGTNSKFIDDILGNYNSSTIYDNTIGRLAKAWAQYTSDLSINVQSKLDAAENLLYKTKIPTIQKLTRDVQLSKFKIQAYRLQREFQSNLDNKSVASAIDFINETIIAIKKNKAGENSEVVMKRDIGILEQIKKEFTVDGEISMEGIYNSFSENEKKALKLIDEAGDIESKYLWVATVIRGSGVKPINNYIHHNVLDITDNKKITDINGAINTSSIEAGTVRERTPGAKAINFDPISSTLSGAKDILLDYHMTNALNVANGIISSVKKTEGLTPIQQEAINAVENVKNELLENALINSFSSLSTGDKIMRFAVKTGYAAALASIPRAGAELGSNLTYALTQPQAFLGGVKNFGGFAMNTVEAMNAMVALNSSETKRLYDTDAMVSNMTDSSLLASRPKKSKKVPSPLLDQAAYIAQFTGVKQLRSLTETVADKTLSTPDKMISRPFWFGAFALQFKKETGISLTKDDMSEISNGTSKYLGSEYDSARNEAVKYADSEMTKMANSSNPFNSTLKNIVKPSDKLYTQLYKTANGYMASFMMGEYNTTRNSILSLLKSGKITKVQATATIIGIQTRVLSYMILYKLFSSIFDSWFGAEDEDDEDLEGYALRQMVGSPISMITGRGLGQLPRVLISLGTEKFNEKYLQDLRDGEEYDSFKHSIVFSLLSPYDIEKKSPEENFIKTISGPYSQAFSTLSNLVTDFKRIETSKKPETVEKYKKDLQEVASLKVLGNLSLLPFYKDIIRIIKKNKYKA